MRRRKPPLELEVRRKVYQTISDSPGLHFRELKRRTGLVIGALQYHLDYLKKEGLVSEEKDRDYSRFYPKDLEDGQKEVLSFLRQESIRRLLLFLLEHPKSKHKKIVSKLALSPSTISWQLKRLTEKGILIKTTKGRESKFEVKEPGQVVKLLITYKKSFLDKLVDSFIASWEK